MVTVVRFLFPASLKEMEKQQDFTQLFEHVTLDMYLALVCSRISMRAESDIVVFTMGEGLHVPIT